MRLTASEILRRKLIEQGICSAENSISIHACRYSVYRREFQWLPRTEITEKAGAVVNIWLSDKTVTELSKGELVVDPLGWLDTDNAITIT